MMDLLLLSRNAAVFIVVIAMLRLVFKWFLPRTAFVVLWLAAAVRMLCPFRLPSEASVWGLLGRKTAAPAGGVTVKRYWFTAAEGVPVQDALPNVCDFLGKVWLFGAMVLLLGIAVLYLGGIWKARLAEPMPDGTYLCRGLDSPRLCGIVHPRILLPEGIGEDLLPYILLHERVHMRRLDNLWKLLALAAVAVHWFNPAAWLMVLLLGRDLEVSCDEWALRSLDREQRCSYALSLIAMAECPRGHLPVACGFSHNPLEERIRNIMTNRKKSMIALSAATAMILCTTSAFATDAPAEADSMPAGSANSDAAAAGKNQYGAYLVTVKDSKSDMEDVTVSVNDGSSPVVTGFDQLEFFTADEYAGYIEEQKVALLAEIDEGKLSQETYDMTIHDMEETLAGLRDGTVKAAKPFEGEDGAETMIVMTTAKAMDAVGYEIKYAAEEDGTFTVLIDNEE